MFFEYRGVRVRLDLMDAADAGAYRAGVAAFRRRAEAGEGGGVCGRMRLFLDDVFGAGAGAALLPEENQAAARACYAALLTFLERQRADVRRRMERAFRRYDPARVEGMYAD